MKLVPYITLIFWLLASFAGNLCAAPVGNIYDPMRWTITPGEVSRPVSLITLMELDYQTNDLPDQMRRFPWIDPDSSIDEERHYEQIRRSHNELSVLGLKIGISVASNSIIYAIVGTSQATIDYHYEDWTESSLGRSFYSNTTFKSDPEVYYGLGATFLMYEGAFRDDLPYSIGMDAQYRRFNIEDDSLKENGTAYDCTLDEVQLAFSLSVQLKTFSPYAGIKVASITGHESYTNTNYASDYFKAGYIQYEDDISWSKNIGYFAGVSTLIKTWFSVGLEVRAGDEKALGINATASF